MADILRMSVGILDPDPDLSDGRLTLNGYEGDEQDRADEGAGPDPLPEEEGDDGELQGPGPQVVEEQDGCVKPSTKLLGLHSWAYRESNKPRHRQRKK